MRVYTGKSIQSLLGECSPIFSDLFYAIPRKNSGAKSNLNLDWVNE